MPVPPSPFREIFFILSLRHFNHSSCRICINDESWRQLLAQRMALLYNIGQSIKLHKYHRQPALVQFEVCLGMLQNLATYDNSVCSILRSMADIDGLVRELMPADDSIRILRSLALGLRVRMRQRAVITSVLREMRILGWLTCLLRVKNMAEMLAMQSAVKGISDKDSEQRSRA